MKAMILAIFLWIAACGSVENVLKTEEIVLSVAPRKVNGVGAHGKQECLQVKKPGEKEWTWVCDGILGFDHNKGYTYRLKVKKEELKDPPADASTIRYSLIEIISKEKEITDKEMTQYDTLTVMEIQQGKDGYTATLKDNRENLYSCTISIPNLGENYVRLHIGDKVKIAGEYVKGDPIGIYAKRILKIK